MTNQSPKYLLAIDNGTQSLRALIFDEKGSLVAKNKVEIQAYVSPKAGWAEQEPEYFWNALCEVCNGLWSQLDFPREQIAAMSVTSQRGTVVTLDKNGEPLRPAISWLDQRRVEGNASLGMLESGIMNVLGVKPKVDEFYQVAEANWIAQEQPELWAKVDKYLLLSGYHTYKLTDQFTDSTASQVGYLPFDFKKLSWADNNDWTWRVMPSLTPEMLPELRPAGSILGNVSEQAALQTGIPAGLPLISSGSDKACEVLGSGCLQADTGSLSYGTTATFNVTSDAYFEAIPFIPAFPGVIPDSFNVEIMINRGYWMVNWFKNEFGQNEQRLAKEQGVSPESLFDDLIKSVPAGSMGLTLQPYWSPTTSTGPEAKGAIIGFGDVHTRAHMYRAMIEGLTYALREGKELVEKRNGQKINTLMVSGGGSQSDEVMQITADIFGMPVERPHTFETSGLGAAIAAAVGVGIYADFKTATNAMTHSGKRFEPITKNSAIYDELYKNVYRKMYKNLKSSYQAIRSITGYPG